MPKLNRQRSLEPTVKVPSRFVILVLGIFGSLVLLVVVVATLIPWR
jgi:hypothetical protein